MATILLVEDILRHDRNACLARFLEDQGHKVSRMMADGEELLAPLQDGDIAIIHLGRASAAGYALTQRLRKSNARMGILLLASEHESVTLRIAGLERGADFCEPLPQRLELLNAYIETMLRRVVPQAWQLDVAARTLRAPHHDAVEINSREVALLKALASSTRHAADRCAIAHAFGVEWVSFDERVLEKTVSRLRRKWRDSTMYDLPLRTLHGVGYCFTEAIQAC
ncbi:MAG: winged helix-turn-helix domain-containing protein [Herbaspirillum huttiense]|uniref:response regulator transcription factor n=1 Tax=Herbaspirillum huttiense TaxID=863372 RepID=UPI001AD30BDC|nr:winged helix-turn-helix domain-containing protein [Herbaspirillum huttiense]MBN9356828.1 winged helix-turn-helix domain-containing protein [Herbaspirillum huttiense]